MQIALYDQNSSWRQRRRVRLNNKPRIDRLHYRRETAFENMNHSRAESQGYVAKRRRRLVKGILAVRAQYEAAKPAYQRAIDRVNTVKQSFNRAKAAHERKQAEFGRAKSDFDRAVRAYNARLEWVRTESAKHENDNRSVAEKAGIH